MRKKVLIVDFAPGCSKKESILQATYELVVEHGLNELTTAKIARRSGTAETVIYRHFAGKHEIITELMQRVVHDFQQKIDAILSQNSPPLEKLENMTAFHLSFFQQTRGVSRVLFSEQVHLTTYSDPFKQVVRSFAKEYRNGVKRIITEGIKSGQFSPELDIEIASMSFIGIIYLLLHEWSLDDFAWPIVDSKDRIINHFRTIWQKH